MCDQSIDVCVFFSSFDFGTVQWLVLHVLSSFSFHSFGCSLPCQSISIFLVLFCVCVFDHCLDLEMISWSRNRILDKRTVSVCSGMCAHCTGRHRTHIYNHNSDNYLYWLIGVQKRKMTDWVSSLEQKKISWLYVCVIAIMCRISRIYMCYYVVYECTLLCSPTRLTRWHISEESISVISGFPFIPPIHPSIQFHSHSVALPHSISMFCVQYALHSVRCGCTLSNVNTCTKHYKVTHVVKHRPTYTSFLSLVIILRLMYHILSVTITNVSCIACIFTNAATSMETINLNLFFWLWFI